MFRLASTSAASCWSVQQKKSADSSSHPANVIFISLSQISCIICHSRVTKGRWSESQISSSSDIQVLFPRSVSNLLFSFLHLSFRSQLLWGKGIWSPRGRNLTKGRGGRMQPLYLGCGGEGSWHRDLMHKEKQKSHCQGFPLLHSSAGDPPHCRVSIAGCFCALAALIGFSRFLMLDVAMESNIGEVRYGDQLSADFSQRELWNSTESVEALTRPPLNVQLSEIQTLHTSRLSNATGSRCKCTRGPCSFTW